MAESFWPGRWAEGCVVAVIASGPSLTARQTHDVCRAAMRDQARRPVKTMAVNNAVFSAWFADWLHGCDYKWWAWHVQEAQHFAGVKSTCCAQVPSAWGVGLIETTGELGYDPDGLRHGSNGAFQCAHIAIRGGARKVVLVGVDCHPSGDHFHGDHPDNIRPDWSDIAGKWESLAEPARSLGVDVVNCSPGTAVKAFRLSSDLAGELRS